MNQYDFYTALKDHCKKMNAECEVCCMRLYCYTPPCEQTDFMLDKVISFLEKTPIHTESHDRSDRCNEIFHPPCPCNMDMSNALGYEPR